MRRLTALCAALLCLGMPEFADEVEERMIGITADDEESDDEGEEDADEGAPHGGDGWESMDED